MRGHIATATLMMVAGVAVATPADASSLESLLNTRWTWTATVDSITDEPIHYAYVLTAVINGTPFDAEEARVLLACTGGKATITIEWSFRAGGKANLRIDYRFAGQPGRRLGARYVNRWRQEVRDLADIRQFLSDARRSERLLVRVSSDAYGSSEANFTARAGRDMADRFIAACPDAAAR